eukprot:78605_1
MSEQSEACTSEQLWKEYQGLNMKFIDTTHTIQKLQKELEILSENQWKQICTKSLHNIRNELVLLQMKDKKLKSENKRLNSDINNYKKEVSKLEKAIKTHAGKQPK